MHAPLNAVAIGAASIEDWYLNSPDHNPRIAMEQLLQRLDASGYELVAVPALPCPVRRGQVWKDDDPRGYGRLLRVVEITETHAIVEQVSARDGYTAQTGRRTRIRLDRFKPGRNGYSLVKDAPSEDGR